MKKSLTRKLTIAVIALVFAVVSLSTSTYAWFTMSDTAQIDAFEADVKAGEGIEIAVTSTDSSAGAQWYTGNVPGSVVEEVIGEVKFDAITTTPTYLSSKTFYGIDDVNKVETLLTEATPKQYVSFFVHVRTAQAGKVSLDSIELHSLNQKNWKVDKDFTKVNGDPASVSNELLYDVANAARVAIKTNSVTIYENNEDAQEVTEVGTLAISEKNTVGTKYDNGALSYWNNKYSYVDNDKMAAPADEKYPGSKQISDLETNDLLLGTTQNAYEEIKFEVIIWIEGWDAECINAIFAQTLSTQFNIKYEE